MQSYILIELCSNYLHIEEWVVTEIYIWCIFTRYNLLIVEISDPCFINPCQNAGTCTSPVTTDGADFTCFCTESHIGDTCHIQSKFKYIYDILHTFTKVSAKPLNKIRTDWILFRWQIDFLCQIKGLVLRLFDDSYNEYLLWIEDILWSELLIVDISDPCSINPCQNDGTCTPRVTTDYFCLSLVKDIVLIDPHGLLGSL